MASLIPGYEYDIFISYRQKDNKGDKWVSEFVEALKTELESTFKEEISVYFDINPHDGLLETHDVDASLKDKLKCLVFIPIISRTYCDPKSFAWEHEFKAFVEETSKDQFGLKVKLPNGNVANRVLPIRIYDLDASDIKLYESILDTVLRGIEFIYEEQGVNRPLKPDDDEKINLKKTKFRNQINKVANAIKEIITAINHHEEKHEEAKKEISKPVSVPLKNNKAKILAGSIIAIVLIVLGLLLIPKLFKSEKKLEKSIAILPFRNDSQDTQNQPFIDGTMEAILNNLCKVADLTVISRTSVEQFRNTTRPIREIAKNLNVNYILEGSGQKYGNSIRLTVQLIDAVNDKHIWSSPYEGVTDNIFSLQSQISEAIASELKAIISPEEKLLIEMAPTKSLIAYDLFNQGRSEYFKFGLDNMKIASFNKAMTLYRQSLQYDSTYAQAYSGLAMGYLAKKDVKSDLRAIYLDSCLFYANKAISYNDQLDEAFLMRALYFENIGEDEKSLKDINYAIEINPNYSWAYWYRGSLINGNFTDSYKAIEDWYKSIQLEHGPLRSTILKNFGDALAINGFPDIGRYYYEVAFKLDMDSIGYLNRLASLEIYQNDLKAVELSDKVLKADPSNLSALLRILNYYERLGKYEDAYNIAYTVLQVYNKTGYSPNYNWDYIGFAYLKTGRIKEARYYFDKQIGICEKVLASDPNSDNSLSTLTRVYSVLGEKAKAIQWLNTLNGIIIERHKEGRHIASSSFQNSLKYNPLLENLRSDTTFQRIQKDRAITYNITHEKATVWLKEKGILK
jgi:TolB-like protein/Tfp pilus assembly protein PilF